MRPPPKNPERALAKILGGYREVEDAYEIIGEAMTDANSDIVPDEIEALGILEKRALESLEEMDDENAVKILVRLGMAHLDPVAFSSELAKAHRTAVRGALKQLAREIKNGSFFQAPPPPEDRRIDLRDQEQVMRAVQALERESPHSLHSIAKKLRPSLPFMDRELFDRAVLSLARKGQLFLHHHDYPESLTDEEREAMVTDGKTYYVGVGLPQ